METARFPAGQRQKDPPPMFRVKTSKSKLALTWGILELIFHSAVRHVRKSHGNAVIGLLMAIMQSVLMVAIMVFVMQLLGMRRMAVRGDFVLYMMTGVFNFATYTQTLTAVAKSEGPTSTMMKHSPMNPIVAIGSAALSTLYLQVLSSAVILFFYHTLWTPITIHEPQYVFGAFILSWFSGIATGMIFRAATPWQPELIGTLTTVYSRLNMIFSGKMLLGNMTPSHIRDFYTWNPLFHTIDQTRGYMFENYHPHYSSIMYPIYVSLALMMIALMGEHYSNRHISLSWGAKR
jgi:ABC-type polysaccharide/polyol phosphate export permease